MVTILPVTRNCLQGGTVCYDRGVDHRGERPTNRLRGRRRGQPVVRYLSIGTLTCVLLHLSAAHPFDQPGPTTELSCNIGMAKGQKTGSCTIAVPDGCVVANFPDTSKPWSNVSKGGVTNCRFDDKGSNWKTRVTGTCDRCKTVQCSARFSVMVKCGG